MERAFYFGDHNTWKEWGMLLTSKSLSPPEVKTNYVEIEGMHGTLDLSETLAGEPTYRNRTISASFISDDGTYEERETVLSEIVNLLHGRKMMIVEPDDLSHYLYGRVNVRQAQNYPTYAVVEVEAVCDPWRYEHDEIINSFAIDGETVVSVFNSGKRTCCPSLTVTGSVTITCNGVTTSVTDGSYKIASFKLFQGENTIALSGSGTLTLTYRRATL